MKVAVLQYPIVWADVKANVNAAVGRIAAVAGKADIALLPEMFSTGFCVDHPELAEPIDGWTISTLQQTADTCDIAIAGSFICEDGGTLYNRGFFLRPHAEPTFQDKRHMYAHGGEDLFFTPGTKRNIIEYKGVRMLMLICYDLRFPVWARNVYGDDYDLILVCANWPEARINFWDVLIQARAVENQCLIVAANIVGDDGRGEHYNGHSAAYDTRLKELLEFPDDSEGTRIAEFSIPSLHHFREVLPQWKDMDRDLLR